MNNLFVGINVSLKDFKVRVMDDQGAEPAKRQRYLNNQPGLEEFIDFICLAQPRKLYFWNSFPLKRFLPNHLRT